MYIYIHIYIHILIHVNSGFHRGYINTAPSCLNCAMHAQCLDLDAL